MTVSVILALVRVSRVYVLTTLNSMGSSMLILHGAGGRPAGAAAACAATVGAAAGGGGGGAGRPLLLLLAARRHEVELALDRGLGRRGGQNWYLKEMWI